MPTLKEWRARRVLTVRGLAEAARVAPSTVYRLENARSRPTFAAIRALSDALGVQPEEVTEFAAAIAAAGQGKAGNVVRINDQKERRIHDGGQREESQSQLDSLSGKVTL